MEARKETWTSNRSYKTASLAVKQLIQTHMDSISLKQKWLENRGRKTLRVKSSDGGEHVGRLSRETARPGAPEPWLAEGERPGFQRRRSTFQWGWARTRVLCGLCLGTKATNGETEQGAAWVARSLQNAVFLRGSGRRTGLPGEWSLPLAVLQLGHHYSLRRQSFNSIMLRPFIDLLKQRKLIRSMFI